ncbi:MAG: GFA family protein [Cyanobacteria bacterium P01_H01_bin.21]
MPFPYTGGCQCGQIRYELQAEPLTLYVCHCTDCQHQSSSAFGMSMPLPRESVKLTKGTPKQWSRPSASGRTVACFFCSNCGTRLFHQPSRNDKITNIKPGTLDDTSWLEPAAHLWTASAQSWVSLSDNMLSIPQQPTHKEFEEIYKRFEKKL